MTGACLRLGPGNYLYTKTCKTLHNALVQPLYYYFDTTFVLTKRLGSTREISLLRCAFRKFQVREGKNARDQITSDRRPKHTWSDCILMHSIHSKWKFKRMLSMGHTCCACLKTTWRLCRLRATTLPSGHPQLSGLIPTRSLFQQNHCLPFEEDRKRTQRD